MRLKSTTSIFSWFQNIYKRKFSASNIWKRKWTRYTQPKNCNIFLTWFSIMDSSMQYKNCSKLRPGKILIKRQRFKFSIWSTIISLCIQIMAMVRIKKRNSLKSSSRATFWNWSISHKIKWKRIRFTEEIMIS